MRVSSYPRSTERLATRNDRFHPEEAAFRRDGEGDDDDDDGDVVDDDEFTALTKESNAN